MNPRLSAGNFRRWRGVGLILATLTGLGGRIPAAPAPGGNVFDGPPCAYADSLAADTATEGSVLRRFSVEERAGVAREGELVRVPLFFAAGECHDVDELAIVSTDSAAAVPEVMWQADDIRRGPDGGVSRVHLWFAIDLAAGERKHFQITRVARGTKALPPVVPLATDGDRVRITTAIGSVAWTKRGELLSLAFGTRHWDFDTAGAAGRVIVRGTGPGPAAATRLTLDRTTARREVEWGSGPLFAKVRVRVDGGDGVAFEEEFRVPRHGREVVLSAAIFPGTGGAGVLVENLFLEGRLAVGGAEIVRVPAGLRYGLRAEHAYTVSALTRPTGEALLAVPLVIGGSNGQWALGADGRLSLRGQSGLQRGNEGEQSSLRAYWSEVRLVPASASAPDGLWAAYRDRVQPLVAIVEEPGASEEALHAALAALAGEMKPLGWRQEAGRALVFGKPEQMMKILQRGPSPKEADPAVLLAGATNARAKITNQGTRRLREDEKGRAYGGLDPYHITYTQSAAAAVAVLAEAPPTVSAVNYAMAKAVRTAGGMTDAAGNPYIDCFSRTLNMQMGPVLFGLTAGAKAGDTDLVRFYRDLATAPPVLGVFGRAQRPYTGAPARTPDPSDFLYQSICDFWLRTAELLAGENLGLHPLAYARYTDCIDVMADRYHGVAPRELEGETAVARANFFRGQVHTHRWLGWSCAPFIRLLEAPAQRDGVGRTEAIRYARLMSQRWKNWPDLTFYVLADLLVRLPPRATPFVLPARPTRVDVRRSGATIDLSWDAVPAAMNYRIYRADAPGGPYVWLNSPYAEKPSGAVAETAFQDHGATESASYVVLAEDAVGRASAWPETPTSP